MVHADCALCPIKILSRAAETVASYACGCGRTAGAALKPPAMAAIAIAIGRYNSAETGAPDCRCPKEHQSTGEDEQYQHNKPKPPCGLTAELRCCIHRLVN